MELLQSLDAETLQSVKQESVYPLLSTVLLNNAGSVFWQYLHGVVDGYIGRSTSHISEHDTLKQLPNPSKSRLAIQLVDIFQQSCQKNDVAHLQERFDKVPKQLIECIVKVTEVRSQEIYEESRKQSILAGLPDSLQDFDWSLRVCRVCYILAHLIIANADLFGVVFLNEHKSW